jgi:hypothetical protein
MTDALAVARALQGGPTTLEILRGRLGHPPHDALAWALADARERGWVAAPDEGDGVCSSGAPVVVRLTDAGRRAS